MTRLFALLLVSSLLACANSTAGAPVTASRPRPSAVSFDPPLHVAPLAAQSSLSASLLVLEEPAPRARLIELLDGFFAAMTREDVATLAALFTSDGEVIATRGGKARAADHWTRRFERLDYGTAFPRLIYSPSTVQILDTPAANDGPSGTPGLLPRPGEVVVRVPTSPTQGNSRLFGKVLELVLRQVDGEYKIRVMREDFELPEARR